MTVPFNYLSGIFHISKGNLNEDENKRPMSSAIYKTVASVLRPCMFNIIIQETNPITLSSISKPFQLNNYKVLYANHHI